MYFDEKLVGRKGQVKSGARECRNKQNWNLKARLRN